MPLTMAVNRKSLGAGRETVTLCLEWPLRVFWLQRRSGGAASTVARLSPKPGKKFLSERLGFQRPAANVISTAPLASTDCLC